MTSHILVQLVGLFFLLCWKTRKIDVYFKVNQ